ncbi:TatD family hydrolase [Cellvibrio japonicus]|nr:TatD family hydrolase [Cellvibrio japonicus]QEI12464.1 TatD family deoxyribonuclease [Cellvibrio japonicus]QEI16038.1 TatD family deoxyribonuclease [Cellvibrio japonicus]QEI19616.1 TatD family deoxyribonuclease [Cellvibrio japonicus]
MIVDSHCHLDRLNLAAYDGNLDEAVAAAHARGIQQMLCIGISLENIPTVIDIARRYPGVVASVGVHPCDVKEGTASVEQLKTWAAQPKVVALGETGLDYHYETESKALQHESFAMHLHVGKEVGLPIVVHTREARADTLALIREHGSLEHSGVLHCFTEDWAMARAALDLNYYISISGIVTFKNAEQIREVVQQMPLDRLLVETDSPYLAPVPYRGKPNEPKYVREVAQFIADLRGMPLEQLAEITTTNFYRLFTRAEQYLPH